MKIHNPSFLFLFFAVFVSQFLVAQSPAALNYNQMNGLPSSEVHDILQDSSGFIWIATDRGVSRFDGYTFENFTSDDGLTDNTVFRMQEDARGRIWFFPFNGNICYYENNKILNYRYNDTLRKYLTGLRIVRSFDVQPDGTVTLGFLDHGIVQVDAQGKFKKINISSSPISQVAIWDDALFGLHWGTSPRIDYRIIPVVSVDAKGQSQFFTQPLTNHNYAMLVTALKKKDKNYLCLFYDYLIEFGVGQPNRVQTFDDRPLRIMEDREQMLWLSLEKKGVFRYAHSSDVFEQRAPNCWLNYESVTSLFEDREGGFWLGTQHQGIFYIPNIGIVNFFVSKTIGTNPTAFLAATRKDTVLMCTPDGHLQKIIHGQKIDFVEFPPSWKLDFLYCDTSSNRIFMGTHQGVYELDEHKKWVLFLQDRVKQFVFVQDKLAVSIWRSFRIGRKDQPLDKMRLFVKKRVEAVLVTHQKEIWVGCIDGLYILKKDTILEAQGFRDTIFNCRVSALAQLHSGAVVVGTTGQGIAIDDGKTIKHINTKSGLLSNIVYAISIDPDDQIWVSTQKGLCLLIPKGDHYEVFVSALLNGLFPGSTMQIITNHDGVFLNTIAGVHFFSRQALHPSQVQPIVRIREVRVGDSLIVGAQALDLNYKQNFIRVSFAGLSYRLLKNQQYRYRLNEDQEWKYTSSNQISLVGLSPGRYALELCAANEAGEWIATPTILRIRIQPPFWKSWWFILLYILFFSALAALLIWMRIRQIKRQGAMREQALHFKQQALVGQMNPHFMFNMLNSIQSQVLNDKREQALNSITKFSRLMRNNMEHIRSGFITLEEELHTLELYLSLEMIRFRDRLSYSVVVEEGIDAQKIQVPAMLFQPLVENAIRHGLLHRPAGGSVTIRIYKKENYFYGEVDDNGIGRKAALQFQQPHHKSSGSLIVADRIRVLCDLRQLPFFYEVVDKVDDHDEPAGTQIRFILPTNPVS